MIKKIRNNKGSILGVTMVMMVTLTLFGYGLINLSGVNAFEVTQAVDNTQTFWSNEAALVAGTHRTVQDPTYAGTTGPEVFGNGSFQISTSTQPNGIIVTALSTNGNFTRGASGRLPFIPAPFNNTVSTGDDLRLDLSGGWFGGSSANVYGKTRIGDTYYEGGGWWSGDAWFEDKQDHVGQGDTTLSVPDLDGNGSGDQFDDFREFCMAATDSVPEGEAVYIAEEDTAWVYPSSQLAGIKVLCVDVKEVVTVTRKCRGRWWWRYCWDETSVSTSGGDVNVLFGSSWEDDQDLTILAAGKVNYYQPLQFAGNSRLSFASWEDYSESSLFVSAHDSVIFSHDDANFDFTFVNGTLTGNVIANGTMFLNEEWWSSQQFYFSDRALMGDLPPGFALLSGGGAGNVTYLMLDWQET